MEELGKRVDVVEEQIRTLREELNRRFDQLAVMIKKVISQLLALKGPYLKRRKRNASKLILKLSCNKSVLLVIKRLLVMLQKVK
jgi:hypothetical protein